MNEIIMFMMIFVPSLDIQMGALLLLSTLITIYLVIKLLEREIIFKTFLFLLLIFSFFTFIVTMEIHDDITFYLTSTGLGILILIVMSASMNWDDESNNSNPHNYLF